MGRLQRDQAPARERGPTPKEAAGYAFVNKKGHAHLRARRGRRRQQHCGGWFGFLGAQHHERKWKSGQSQRPRVKGRAHKSVAQWCTSTAGVLATFSARREGTAAGLARCGARAGLRCDLAGLRCSCGTMRDARSRASPAPAYCTARCKKVTRDARHSSGDCREVIFSCWKG